MVVDKIEHASLYYGLGNGSGRHWSGWRRRTLAH